jgi:UDP-N-acetylglucosamine 2-epimerase (non-hydrolysing)
VTLHRPANVDEPAVLSNILEILGTVASACPIVFPVHPRTRQRLTGRLPSAGIAMIDPTGYLDFVALEASARLVLTDSGGVQEETTVLGVPCLTLRDNTERPITVSEGTNSVVGRDPARVAIEVARILEHGVVPRRPALWDGHAGERIAEVLLASADRVPHPRPTERYAQTSVRVCNR